MKTRKAQTLLALVLLVSLTLMAVWPAAAQDGEPPRQAPQPSTLPSGIFGPGSPGEFKAGEVLVKFRGQVSARSAEVSLARVQATRLETIFGSDVEVVQVPEGQELAVVDQLKADSNVEYAEPNYRYYAFGVPNDPNFGKQWGLTKVQGPAAWDISTGSSGTIIAVIDSGIDMGHPDLAAKIVAGYDFVAGDSTPGDENGHGTHVSGIAAAVTNNSIGVAGMDWGARIMPLRVLDNQGSGWSSDVTAGINYAWQHGAKVLNLSLGSTSYSQAMQDAVNDAHSNGSLVVAAMGNCRVAGNGCPVANPTSYPAAYDNVMAVAATGPGDVYASYSQYGPHCDIAAPGGDMSYYHDPAGIYSTMPTYAVYLTTNYSYYKNYDYLNGTSQATPFVSGLAALLWGTNPSLMPDDVQTIIQSTAVDLGPAGKDPDYGWGRINAYAALQANVTPGVPTLNPISNPGGDGDYLVTWTSVANATGYTLEMDSSPSFGFPTTAYTGPNAQFQVTNQGPGTWYYRVNANNANGTSAWSNVQSVSVKPNAPALDPISNASQQSAYTVSWSVATGANGYTLEEDDNAGFTTPKVRYMGSALQYDVTGQPAGTWYYRVQAYNDGGNSSWSNTESTVVAPLALGAPTLAPISNPDGDGSYLVDWTDVVSATGYTLEQSRDPWFSAPTQVYSNTASQYSVTNQPRGTWFYRVRAVGPTGDGPWSNEESVVVKTWVFLPVVVNNYSVQLPTFGLPINEGFEGGFMPPTDWTQIVNDTNFYTATWTIASSTPFAGTYYATCYWDHLIAPQDEILLGPTFQANTAQLQFESFGSVYWCRDTYNNCDLNVWLVVGAWGGGDDVLVGKADNDWIANWTWSHSTMDLTPYLAGGPVRIAFQYVGQDGAQVALDAIQITGN